MKYASIKIVANGFSNTEIFMRDFNDCSVDVCIIFVFTLLLYYMNGIFKTVATNVYNV